MEDIISRQFSSVSGEEGSPLESFIQEAYKNRLVEQADLHEVASQLIELGEAILITRDAIVSADVVEGRMSRTLDFENADKALLTVQQQFMTALNNIKLSMGNLPGGMTDNQKTYYYAILEVGENLEYKLQLNTNSYSFSSELHSSSLVSVCLPI